MRNIQQDVWLKPNKMKTIKIRVSVISLAIDSSSIATNLSNSNYLQQKEELNTEHIKRSTKCDDF